MAADNLSNGAKSPFAAVRRERRLAYFTNFCSINKTLTGNKENNFKNIIAFVLIHTSQQGTDVNVTPFFTFI